MRAAQLVLALLALVAAPGAGATPPLAGKPRPKVCLVLSGGGARGLAHIGVLRVLEELRVPIDCIVGTSAGAVIGGAYAAGASPGEIEAAMRGADWDQLLSDAPPRPDHSVYGKELDRAQLGATEVGLRGTRLGLKRGVINGQQLQFFLRALVGTEARGSFDQLPVQYRALATDFETGTMVVLEQGDLAAAIRASMSVPGAFAPVEVDGRILVDGGLVRNVGVDVARQLGAERVIAVNVGTPLMKREELDSLLSAAAQTINILTEQNVAASLASLGPQDVLITPQLGGFGAADFAHGTTLIPAGEAAARLAADRLAPLALDRDAYAAWRDAQRHPHGAPRYAHVRVDTAGLSRVRPAAVQALVGAEPDPREVDDVIAALLGTDDFEAVTATVLPAEGGATLVLTPVEKPWGPNYLHAGGALASDFAGRNEFLLAVDYRATWLTERGLEWRGRASIGWLDALESQLRQPLDVARRTFIAPSLAISQQERSVYQDHDPLATFRVRRMRLALDFGTYLGSYGEFRLGVEGGYDSAALTSGEPVQPDLRARVGAWRASLVVDRLDSLDFPRRGFLLSADAHLARRMLGGGSTYDRLSFEAEQAFGGERTSLLLAAHLDTSRGTDLPLAEAFTLGGFQSLSGLRRDQILAERIALLRAVLRERLAAAPPLLPAIYGGVSLEAADVAHRLDAAAAGRLYGGSVFLSADSALGPLYLGAGLADGGFVSLYFYVGRPP